MWLRWTVEVDVFYKQVESFRVHCLLTGQFNNEDYVTFTDVICELEEQQVAPLYSGA